MNQLGTILNGVWGALHLLAAYQVHKLGSRLSTGAAQGRLLQIARNLAHFAVFVSAVAVACYWPGSALGSWLSLVTASVTVVGLSFTSLHLAMYRCDLACWVQPYGSWQLYSAR